MSRIIAMGSPLGLGGRSSGWDLWPLVGILASLVLLRFVVEVRLRLPLVLGSVIVGSVFASVVNVCGVVVGFGTAIAFAFAVRLVLPRILRDDVSCAP